MTVNKQQQTSDHNRRLGDGGGDENDGSSEFSSCFGKPETFPFLRCTASNQIRRNQAMVELEQPPPPASRKLHRSLANDDDSDDGNSDGLFLQPAADQMGAMQLDQGTKSIAEDEWTPPAALLMAEKLDFNKRNKGGLRPLRKDHGFSDDEDGIEIATNRTRPTQAMRWVILLLAREWGHNFPSLPKKKKQQTAEAACRLVAHDFGHSKPPKGTQLSTWNKALEDSLELGERTLEESLRLTEGNQWTTMTDKLEEQCPGHLASIFREAQKTEGHKESWPVHCEATRCHSSKLSDPRPAIKTSPWQSSEWSKRHKGKSKVSVARPILTEPRKKERCQWSTHRPEELDRHCQNNPKCKEWLSTQNETNADVPTKLREPHSNCGKHLAFLDEKWFCCASRRRKIKHLPKQDCEEPGVDDCPPERVASRRLTTKAMFMGVVACPHPDQNFDGKILVQRASQKKTAKKNACCENVVDNFEANRDVHSRWRQLHDFSSSNITAGELLDKIAAEAEWETDEPTRDHLVLRCFTHSTNGKKKKWVTIGEEELVLGRTGRIGAMPDAPRENTPLSGIELQFARWSGEECEQDVACDSAFVAEWMDTIGQKMREACRWVDAEEEIGLVMDNAGGHGTKDCIDQHTKLLEEKHNMRIIHQVARSPETNLLDLGTWVGMQCCVEKLHRKRTKASADALARTVMEGWRRCDSCRPFRSVFKRWEKVLRLILAGNGDNTLVDKARKKVMVPTVMMPPTPVDDTDVEDEERVDSDIDDLFDDTADLAREPEEVAGGEEEVEADGDD